jgi:hypothetical protein
MCRAVVALRLLMMAFVRTGGVVMVRRLLVGIVKAGIFTRSPER